MTDGPVARRRRTLGCRRHCAFLLAMLVMLFAGASATEAASATPPGGAGLPAGAAVSPHGAQHAAPHTHRTARRASANPFAVRGMWIWYVSMSNHGNLASIIATAHRYGVGTLMIKSGDGSSKWSQFSAQLVATLHANGLRVCGWQYVYGSDPAAEARVGAAAVRSGADCLLIDAETEYEGKYVQAQTYTTTLRKLIGPGLPVALASFPYVDYHPGFPYSVFLGPGGAQYNVPQMYWVDIGVSVDDVYSHTYDFNRPYGRAIYPLGQIYNNPPPNQVVRFRQLSVAYGGGGGVSWWDWQEATPAAWRALSQPIAGLAGFSADNRLASVGRGGQGDLVVWAQEHLVSAGQRIPVDGAFGPKTQAAVGRFQHASGLHVTGAINASTWQALLRFAAASVHWTPGGARIASAAARSGTVMPVPKSASLPAVRNEIAGAGGRG